MTRLSLPLQTTLAGVLGFVLSEAFNSADGGTLLTTILSTAGWTALLMLPLSLALLAAENTLGLRGCWHRNMGRILLPALLLGALSGALAQFLYALALNYSSVPPRLVRSLGWGLMGIGVGLVLGLADRSWSKAGRGALGGLVGGLIGGLLFDSFGALRTGPDDTGTLARMVGLTVLGAAIGFMLRLSQELGKRAWLTGTSAGPVEGKQFILTGQRVTVGRAPGADIALMRDLDVPERAGQLLLRDGRWQWEGEPITIDGQVRSSGVLSPGSRVQVGSSAFVFQSRDGAEAGPPLVLLGPDGSVPVPVSARPLSVGTSGAVRIAGTGVLARHATVRWQGGALALLASGPITVNDELLAPGQTRFLRAGDLLRFGESEYALVRDRN